MTINQCLEHFNKRQRRFKEFELEKAIKLAVKEMAGLRNNQAVDISQAGELQARGGEQAIPASGEALI